MVLVCLHVRYCSLVHTCYRTFESRLKSVVPHSFIRIRIQVGGIKRIQTYADILNKKSKYCSPSKKGTWYLASSERYRYRTYQI
jgi:hypothetical protein